MEKKTKKANLFKSLCVWAGFAAVLVMLLAVAARFFARTVLVGMLGVSKDDPVIAKVLKNRMKNDFEEEITAPETLADVKKMMSQLTGTVENAVENDLLGRSIVTRAVNRAENRLGIKTGVFDGETMYDLDGYLIWVSPKKTDEAIASSSENVPRFCDLLRSKGIEVLYVMVPPRVSPEADWPSGTVDFTVENHRAKAEWLEKCGIPVLDLNEALAAEGLDPHALFFRTDHHWKPSAGLWASGKIARTLTENYGLSVSTAVLDPENYRVETLKKAFLGSMGKKITEQRAVPDDLELWYPAYETDITVSFQDMAAERGGFSLLYDMAYYDPGTPLSDQDPYSVYLRGNLGRVTIENNLAENDTRLLIVGDSYDNVLVPFLSETIRSVDVFDLRSYGSRFFSAVEGEKYDLALVMTDSLRYALD